MPQKPSIPRACVQCGASFLALPHTVRAGLGLYCSRSCRDQSRRDRVLLTCVRCGNEFEVCRSTAAIPGNGRFCSRTCKEAVRPLLPHPTDPNALLVPLSRGLFAAIDRADADIVGRYNWCALKAKNTWYAVRKRPRGEEGTTHELMHQAIMPPEPGFLTDHWDGNGLDNRRANLRYAVYGQNAANSRRPATNTSGFKGAFWNRQRNCWFASITVDGRTKYLGRFASAEAAARAYDAKAKEVHGDFARLNFPGDG